MRKKTVRFDASRQVRTSETDPYQIDLLPTETMGRPFSLGMGAHPGRKDCGTFAEWDRDLAVDFKAIWGRQVRTIVCMVEQPEFTLLGIPNYIRDAEAFGFNVIWFQVPDVSVPVSYKLLHKACSEVWTSLNTGNVLVHCRGGKGRTGIFACCFLQVLGLSFLDALKLVRATRKGTVETLEQECWCEDFGKMINPVRLRTGRSAAK